MEQTPSPEHPLLLVRLGVFPSLCSFISNAPTWPAVISSRHVKAKKKKKEKKTPLSGGSAVHVWEVRYRISLYRKIGLKLPQNGFDKRPYTH